MHYDITRVDPFGLRLQPEGEAFPIHQIPIERLRHLLRMYHLLVLRGFQTFSSAEAFADYCSKWGEVSIWPFGKVLELVEQKNPADHIFDNNYVPLHWDGMYRPQVPEFQI
ncbi:TauD/TfdA family dioxygenase, partial [bacterium]|nr:TauD/TfdA family dioxygenase [bacterium]